MNALTGVQPNTAEQTPALDAAAIERLLESEVQKAVNHIYGTDLIAAERERNLDYYNMIMADVPAAKGQSKYVEPLVRTYINMMIPSLMRIFFSGRDYAVFSHPDKSINDLCKAITRFMNDTVFRKDNNGIIISRGAIKDALLCKVGMLKAWWREDSRHEDQTYDNLDDAQFTMLMQQALASGLEPVGYSGPYTDGSGAHSVTLRKTIDTSKVVISGIPPEEWIISQDARTLEDAVLRAHRYGEKVGELVKRGYDFNILKELTDYADPTQSKSGQITATLNGRRTVEDPMLREVTVYEGIILCDPDGQGLREHFFVAGGSSSKVKLLEIEPYHCQVVFADLQSDHDPHNFWGPCPGDDLAQLQKLATVVARQMMMNLYLSNTPQREVVADWIINPDQLLNFTPGNPVRVKQPNAIREMAVPFTAQHSLTVLDYVDQRAQAQTGANKQNAGLDPETLSNQTATAAQLAYQSSMGRMEDVARNLRVGLEKLFRGLFKLVTTYGNAGKVIAVEGQQTQIDPKQWKNLSDLDITINTGLGAGNRDRDANFLFQNLNLQSQFLKEVGPNPAVNFNTLMDSYELWLEALGVENPRQISGKLPPGWAPQPAPPQPSPDTVLAAQTENAKAEKEHARGVLKIQLEAQNDAVKEANRHQEALLSLANDQGKIQVAAAEAALDVEMRQRELEAKIKGNYILDSR